MRGIAIGALVVLSIGVVITKRNGAEKEQQSHAVKNDIEQPTSNKVDFLGLETLATMCIKEGGMCISNIQCCIGTECSMGKCTKNCTKYGEDCERTGQCCNETMPSTNTSICFYGQCRGCVQIGDPCEVSDNCCNATEAGCPLGVCIKCKKDGDACGPSDECCAGVCNANKCQCAAVNQTCTSTSQCCGVGVICTNDKCTLCVKAGERCESSSECCDDDCRKNKCFKCAVYHSNCTKDDDCCKNTNCRKKICEPCSNLHELCMTDEQCCGNNYCHFSKCVKCIGEGDPCRNITECCDDKFVPTCSVRNATELPRSSDTYAVTRCGPCKGAKERCDTHIECCNGTSICRPFQLESLTREIILNYCATCGESGALCRDVSECCDDKYTPICAKRRNNDTDANKICQGCKGEDKYCVNKTECCRTHPHCLDRGRGYKTCGAKNDANLIESCVEENDPCSKVEDCCHDKYIPFCTDKICRGCKGEGEKCGDPKECCQDKEPLICAQQSTSGSNICRKCKKMDEGCAGDSNHCCQDNSTLICSGVDGSKAKKCIECKKAGDRCDENDWECCSKECRYTVSTKYKCN